MGPIFPENFFFFECPSLDTHTPETQMPEVIDLITPPPSPMREEEAQTNKRSFDQVDPSDDVEFVETPKTVDVPGSSTSHCRNFQADSDTSDNDVEYMGYRGDIALVDYPHARENCVQCPFSKGNVHICCNNCYCFVCDVPYKECIVWEEHCNARSSDPKWTFMRAAMMICIRVQRTGSG